jgi:hypothetical protein
MIMEENHRNRNQEAIAMKDNLGKTVISQDSIIH